MILRASVRQNAALLVAAASVISAILGAAAVWLLMHEDWHAGAASSRPTIIIATMLLLIGVIGGFVYLVVRLLEPITVLTRASSQIAKGRHPDEAFEVKAIHGELEIVADSIRMLSLRLREIDATDRRFLMSISHELRTPLTAITGHAQAIEDFAEDAELRQTSLGVIRLEAARLERLIEDIVDLARLRSNRFNTVTESVWLHELGAHLLEIFDSNAADKVAVTGNFEEVLFHSDGQRILQIVRNLIGNALRYAASEVSVTGSRIGGSVCFSVFNDGEPIPDSRTEIIFEPFVGAKREGGMGLGLAIGRELAWALGGNLECVPCAIGARFDLTLPLEPPDFGR